MALNIQIMPVTPLRQNCSLLWCDETREAVLVDVGGDVDWVWEEINKLGLHIKEIWLTHGHLDHVGGVPFWQEKQNTPIIGPHHEDEFLLERLPEITASYGFPVAPAFTPTRYLQEGEKLKVGKFIFDVLHIPGHTPGHVVFYCASQNLLIAGDTLFYESIGRTDFPRSNHQDLVDSISQKLFTLPDETNVIAGHGRTTTIKHEKRHNPFIHF